MRSEDGGRPVGTRVFRRAARPAPPEVPSGEVHLEAPPEIPRAVPTSPLLRLLPLLMVLGSLGFIVVIGVDNPTSWLFGGMFALSTVGMVAGGATRGRRAAPGGGRRGPQGLPALPRPDARPGPRGGARPAGRPGVGAPRPAGAVVDRREPPDVGAPPVRPGLLPPARRPRLPAPRHPARPAADRPGRRARADRDAGAAPVRPRPLDRPRAADPGRHARRSRGGRHRRRRGEPRGLGPRAARPARDVPHPRGRAGRGGHHGAGHARSGSGRSGSRTSQHPTAVDGVGPVRMVAARWPRSRSGWPRSSPGGGGSPAAPRRPPTAARGRSSSRTPRSPAPSRSCSRRAWPASP